MYYACFYAVSGLLLQSEIDGVKSHEGVRQKFSQHFILTGKFPKEWGRFYSILFNNRSAADYEDFKNFDLAATQEMYPKGKHTIFRLDAHYSQTYLCAITK